eukprot:4472459-Amphidinium_carterae.1
MRMTQATLGTAVSRLSCYVDDPICSLYSTPGANRRNVAMAILLWLSLGYPLSFAKGQLGSSVQWTSVHLTLHSRSVKVEIKPQLLLEIQTLLDEHMSSNVISLRALRKLTGKLSHVAS